MADLFALLSRFIEYLFCWLPRPVYVSRIATAVRWTFGHAPRTFSGKIFWIVPLFQSYEELDLRADAVVFPPRVYWTKDGKEAAVGMVVVWRIGDAVRCAETVNGLNDMVRELGSTVLPELVGDFTLDELKRKAAGGEGRERGFNHHLTRKLGALLMPYGIAVDEAQLNFTSDRVRTFQLISPDTGGRTSTEFIIS